MSDFRKVSLCFLFLFLSFPLLSVDSSSTELVEVSPFRSFYRQDDYTLTKKWIKKVVLEGRRHDLTYEDICSPHAFEIFLVKTLTSFGHASCLLNFGELPEFMAYQVMLIRRLEYSMNYLVSVFGKVDQLKQLLERQNLSLSREKAEELLSMYSSMTSKNRRNFLSIYSSIKAVKNEDELIYLQRYFAAKPSQEEIARKKTQLYLLLRETLEQGYSKKCSLLPEGQYLQGSLIKVAEEAKALIQFFSRHYKKALEPFFHDVRIFPLLLKLAQTDKLKKKDFEMFQDFEFKKISDLMTSLRSQKKIDYFSEKSEMLSSFILEVRKSFSERNYKIAPWLDLEEASLRDLFFDFHRFFNGYITRREKFLENRRGLVQEIPFMRTGYFLRRQ